jgi:hypothetical protein
MTMTTFGSLLRFSAISATLILWFAIPSAQCQVRENPAQPPQQNTANKLPRFLLTPLFEYAGDVVNGNVLISPYGLGGFRLLVPHQKWIASGATFLYGKYKVTLRWETVITLPKAWIRPYISFGPAIHSLRPRNRAKESKASMGVGLGLEFGSPQGWSVTFEAFRRHALYTRQNGIESMAIGLNIPFGRKK